MDWTWQTNELMQYGIYSLAIVWLAQIFLARVGAWAIEAVESSLS
jgi:hypothetical protein